MVESDCADLLKNKKDSQIKSLFCSVITVKYGLKFLLKNALDEFKLALFAKVVHNYKTFSR